MEKNCQQQCQREIPQIKDLTPLLVADNQKTSHNVRGFEYFDLLGIIIMSKVDQNQDQKHSLDIFSYKMTSLKYNIKLL